MTYRTQSQKWSAVDDRVLARLWDDGLTARQITERFEGRTRNSILGRVHRLGLPKRPSPIKTNPVIGDYSPINTKPCPAKARELEAGRQAAIEAISKAT